MPTQARKGVFISYARSDGEEFANHLRQRLESEHIPLWQDRVGLEGGRDWWLQITDALDRVEFMALVITPTALESITVRKEWRYARQEGVCVYPIKGTPDLDIDSLPRWMRSLHFYDVDREWQKFVEDLKTRCRTPRVPFAVRDLPEGFVPRPAEFDQLIKLLIDERHEEPVAITAALRGAGGYGKTTLALALCHDRRIQEAFDDGILWVDLGEKPANLTDKVKNLIVILGGERPDFTDLDPVVNRLEELIADRDLLIVVDDVWNSEDLKPFIQGGPRCARLITTRDFATLPASAAKVRVDAMQQVEAVRLLALGLDQDSVELSGELTGLASRLGEWPLLLRLVNGALRHGIENDNQMPRDAIAWVDKLLSTRGLTSFDADNPEHREQAVSSTIGVSLDLLKPEERERYGELAIFPEDVDVPVATLEKLWGTTGGFDEIATELLCKRLNRFSLLWIYDANRRYIRLHNVVRKFLIGEQRGKLPSIHAQLLDAHRQGASWSEMPVAEPYLWDHLAYHLIEAGRGDELVATVKDWRYVVAKTLIRKSLAVQADLLAAEQIAGDDDSLRLLRRNYVNSGHLLNRCENRAELEVTLFSRLQHLDGLKPFTTPLKQHLLRPCVEPIGKLPDLPPPLLVRTLSGHTAWVNSCAMSADGATVVSACDDQTLKVWDGQSGAERFTLSGHTSVVKGCAISADGTIIVSASFDQTLKVWDGQSGAERFTLIGHSGAVTGCAMTGDGATIVSASEDQTLKVWDGRSGVERFTLRGHAGEVRGCAVSADGTMVVSASEDQTVKVWDGGSGAERFTLRGHVDAVLGCGVSADGRTIVSASRDQTLKVWDGYSGAERFTLSGHTNWVRGCCVSADGTMVVSAGDDATVRVWDGRSGVERLILAGHSGWVLGCAVSADGATIVSSSWDMTLKVWDVRSEFGLDETARFMPSGHVGEVNSCAVSADGATVVSASNDHTLKVWDGRSGVERFTLSGHMGDVNSCAVSADGATVVSASDDQTLKVWDGRRGVERFTLRGHTDRVYDCAVSADGATIVSSSWDETLKVWDGRSGTERFNLRGHRNVVLGCAVNADGTTIVSASLDQVLKVWDGRSGTERFTLRGHKNWVRACAVSADGAIIVSASDDQTLKVWDGRNGVERFSLGYASEVWGCAISADGSTIVSASNDQRLMVRDGRTGECLATLPVDGLLLGCGCSANGDLIVAAGARGVYFLRLVR